MNIFFFFKYFINLSFFKASLKFLFSELSLFTIIVFVFLLSFVFFFFSLFVFKLFLELFKYIFSFLKILGNFFFIFLFRYFIVFILEFYLFVYRIRFFFLIGSSYYDPLSKIFFDKFSEIKGEFLLDFYNFSNKFLFENDYNIPISIFSKVPFFDNSKHFFYMKSIFNFFVLFLESQFKIRSFFFYNYNKIIKPKLFKNEYKTNYSSESKPINNFFVFLNYFISGFYFSSIDFFLFLDMVESILFRFKSFSYFKILLSKYFTLLKNSFLFILINLENDSFLYYLHVTLLRLALQRNYNSDDWKNLINTYEFSFTNSLSFNGDSSRDFLFFLKITISYFFIYFNLILFFIFSFFFILFRIFINSIYFFMNGKTISYKILFFLDFFSLIFSFYYSFLFKIFIFYKFFFNNFVSVINFIFKFFHKSFFLILSITLNYLHIIFVFCLFYIRLFWFFFFVFFKKKTYFNVFAFNSFPINLSINLTSYIVSYIQNFTVNNNNNIKKIFQFFNSILPFFLDNKSNGIEFNGSFFFHITLLKEFFYFFLFDFYFKNNKGIFHFLNFYKIFYLRIFLFRFFCWIFFWGSFVKRILIKNDLYKQFNFDSIKFDKNFFLSKSYLSFFFFLNYLSDLLLFNMFFVFYFFNFLKFKIIFFYSHFSFFSYFFYFVFFSIYYILFSFIYFILYYSNFCFVFFLYNIIILSIFFFIYYFFVLKFLFFLFFLTILFFFVKLCFFLFYKCRKNFFFIYLKLFLKINLKFLYFFINLKEFLYSRNIGFIRILCIFFLIRSDLKKYELIHKLQSPNVFNSVYTDFLLNNFFINYTKNFNHIFDKNSELTNDFFFSSLKNLKSHMQQSYFNLNKFISFSKKDKQKIKFVQIKNDIIPEFEYHKFLRSRNFRNLKIFRFRKHIDPHDLFVDSRLDDLSNIDSKNNFFLNFDYMRLFYFDDFLFFKDLKYFRMVFSRKNLSFFYDNLDKLSKFRLKYLKISPLYRYFYLKRERFKYILTLYSFGNINPYTYTLVLNWISNYRILRSIFFLFKKKDYTLFLSSLPQTFHFFPVLFFFDRFFIFSNYFFFNFIYIFFLVLFYKFDFLIIFYSFLFYSLFFYIFNFVLIYHLNFFLNLFYFKPYIINFKNFLVALFKFFFSFLYGKLFSVYFIFQKIFFSNFGLFSRCMIFLFYLILIYISFFVCLWGFSFFGINFFFFIDGQIFFINIFFDSYNYYTFFLVFDFLFLCLFLSIFVLFFLFVKFIFYFFLNNFFSVFDFYFLYFFCFVYLFFKKYKLFSYFHFKNILYPSLFIKELNLLIQILKKENQYLKKKFLKNK